MRAKDTLSQLATKYYLSTKEDLSKHKDWTISCDGTTDVTKIATYVFNISRAGSQHYLKIVDLSAQRHSAEELAQSVEDTLSDYDINLNHVIAVATDNTGNVTSMKELLQQKSDGRIIPIKCFLHWLNLIVKDIMGCFKLLVLEKNCRIISFIHRSTLWSNAVKIKSKEYSIKHGLSSFCETRWYSIAKVCLGIHEHYDLLKDLVNNGFKGEILPEPEAQQKKNKIVMRLKMATMMTMTTTTPHRFQMVVMKRKKMEREKFPNA